jgi:hypothetical protein
MTLTTSLRNVGLGLVIATGSFAGTPAVTAVLAYGLFEIVGSLLLALLWSQARTPPVFATAGVHPLPYAVQSPPNQILPEEGRS